MSDKHTPGPWKAEHRETSLAVYQRTRSGAKTGRPICVVSRKDIANAHLIAAVPDLLDALQAFALDKCYFSESGFAPNTCIGTPTCRSCRARAAIVKAVGYHGNQPLSEASGSTRSEAQKDESPC